MVFAFFPRMKRRRRTTRSTVTSWKPRFEPLEDRIVLSILFDKPLDLGAPAFGHGAQSRPGAQKIAEDFVLPTQAVADGITFYGCFFDNPGNTGAFDIMFFKDSG